MLNGDTRLNGVMPVICYSDRNTNTRYGKKKTIVGYFLMFVSDTCSLLRVDSNTHNTFGAMTTFTMRCMVWNVPIVLPMVDV
jgi:hypothetical protein